MDILTPLVDAPSLGDGDVVTVATPLLGALVNRVNRSDRIAPWTFGARGLMESLARRGVVAALRGDEDRGDDQDDPDIKEDILTPEAFQRRSRNPSSKMYPATRFGAASR